MGKIELELTDEAIENYLSKKRLLQESDSVLEEDEGTISDFLASPEADFTKRPEGKMILEKFAEYWNAE